MSCAPRGFDLFIQIIIYWFQSPYGYQQKTGFQTNNALYLLRNARPYSTLIYHGQPSLTVLNGVLSLIYPYVTTTSLADQCPYSIELLALPEPDCGDTNTHTLDQPVLTRAPTQPIPALLSQPLLTPPTIKPDWSCICPEEKSSAQLS